MGNQSGDIRAGDAGCPLERRDFLRKAAVGGTGAFAIPMIVSVDPADAQSVTSPPPEPPGAAKEPDAPGVDLVGSPGAGTGTTGDRGTTSRSVFGRTELPRTGADIDRMLTAGLAATAGGVALVLWSGDAQRTSTPEPPSPGPADPETAA
jgi:hypothetical protein